MLYWLNSLYLTLYQTFYWGVRFLVGVYLTTTKEDDSDYLITEREWLDDNNNLVRLLKVKNDGHIRSFILTDSLSLQCSVNEIDWNKVICFGNNILACLLGTTEGTTEVDVTEDIKRYSHYILYNDFFTLDDFVKVTKSFGSDKFTFTITIIYSDLEEREIRASGGDTMKNLIFQ